ncbi:PilB [Grimontia sp. AD028]|uniref:Peptide methionine sulfoxide reductase MsrB n=2 Tax=Grimontia TaxID=246861 RepID=R1GM77_9GAMM|nr:MULTISPECIES: peptide-methionine (R)-S-oxide reductase MsrB [Grimontia]EOD77209.1 Peptide methionine sulfoxide reductase MsrB [Grimontia indica]KKD60472.1 PilB [Grimontia sp. AD028]NGN99816.1 peptide-methionine (R)-S-oxide reductase MsrB [Grimontia sedimenti]
MLNWDSVITTAKNGNPVPPRRVEKSEVEWQAELSQEQFYVTRKHGTERPFSSEMCGLFEPGIYTCVCCGERLFNANEKFDSGTGWPSFTAPLEDNVVAYNMDISHGMTRVEVTCNVCDAHLGHVFPDGPLPTRLRYCINAVALAKEK